MTSPAQAESFPPAEVALLAPNLHASSYITVAAFVIWLWDILSNLDIEVSLIWTREGALVKTFYGLIRYTPLIVLLPMVWLINPIRGYPISTRLHVSNLLWFCGVITMSVTTVFTLRVYALYVNNRFIKKLLVIVVTAINLALLGLVLVTATIISRNQTWVPSLNTCLSTRDPQRFYSLYYGSTLIAEIIIAIATFYHATQFHRKCRSLRRTNPGIVIAALHRDGFSYFAMQTLNSMILPMLTVLEFAIMCTLTCHWLLVFRRLATILLDDPQSTEPGWATGPSITVRPAAIDTVTRSFGFAAWTATPEHSEATHSLQMLGGRHKRSWPE
ncbi:hypothetical protein PIIN_10559 [Serendipita indica DSM 11827]|uniref:DUF6533 domain-containing protein n=1 Tax=Serendipita indica (strain DSM 11827) TaxID=1109443 RepID=G4TZ24_SERID|nr:hypothetical protein PIIN_10559 [Serendipita indica DSM 11827]